MNSELTDIDQRLRQLLSRHVPPLRIRVDTPANFEVAGTKPAMQGKQKVEGFYFASVVPKPGDIRFYFFPNYTHPKALPGLSPELQKCLKGKSCFHIKKLTPEMERELATLVKRGVDLYLQDGVI